MTDLWSYKSEMTFEQLNEFYKNRDRNIAVILTMYHWSENLMTKEDLIDQRMWACDNSNDWNIIRYKGLHLYALECIVRNPLFRMEHWLSAEHHTIDDPTSKRIIGKRPVDCVIHTPHKWSDEPQLREILFLNAKKSIISVKHLGTCEKGESLVPTKGNPWCIADLETINGKRIEEERDLLANAIAELGVGIGLIRPDALLTGPHLLQICQDIKNIQNQTGA